jgi:hypothetical protein
MSWAENTSIVSWSYDLEVQVPSQVLENPGEATSSASSSTVCVVFSPRRLGDHFSSVSSGGASDSKVCG